MEFTKESMLPFLLSQVEVVKSKEGQTLQFTVDPEDVRKANPDRIWVNLRSHPGLEEITQPDVLEVVAQDGMIMQVHGIQEITRYCRTESVSSVPHTWTQRIAVSRQDVPDEMSFHVYAMVHENRTMQLDEIPSTWEEAPKSYSLHKRFTYKKSGVSIIWDHMRIGKDAFMNMYESDVTRAPIEYQLSMELENPTTEAEVADALMLLCQIVDGTPYPLVKTKQEEVADAYQHIVNKIVTRRKPNGNGKGNRNRKVEKYHFFAPKPVTLEKVNVSDPSTRYGVISILSGYTVTEKADGERILLYVHTDGRVYTINNTMDVRQSGLKVTSERLHGTIIDGELVSFDQRHDDSKKDLFLAFDLYFLQGESMINLPLMTIDGKPSRFGKLKAILEDNDLWIPISRNEETYMELRVKNHVLANGEDMFAACREILQNASSYPYDIDGLVFTPANLSVFGYYPGKPVKVTENTRWDRVFKWKPAEQNTIDFLVEQDAKPYIDPMTKKRYAVFKLYTGYNANQWEAVSVMNGLRLRYDKTYYEEMMATEDVYRTRLFQPITQYSKGVECAYIPMDNAMDPIAENGDVVRDRSIVEFAYDPNASGPVSCRWKAHRVREDKTRIFQKKNELSKTANDLTVALSIWRTIHAPVTREMITGVAPVANSDIPDDLEERLLGVDDTYYAREVPRAHMLSVHMLNFHNQGIKKMLYERSQRKNGLLELACGMAGDLPRWRDSAYRFILGVDLVRDNITHPREGSYARMVRQRRAVTTMVNGIEKLVYPDMVFVIGDCALPLHDGSASKDLDEESRKVLQMVFRKNAAPLAPYLKFLARRASNRFDVVSCQFAIHYFFQTPEKLHGFLDNVSKNLVKGGIFIATFMDGERVHNLVSKSPSGIVEGRKLDDAVPVWAIIKKYDQFVYTPGEEEPFGKMVDVFLENTNRLIPEFLVNLQLLMTYAASHGLELTETELFSETFAKLRSAVPENPSARTELDQNLVILDKDDVQKQFSFLNRWVVFRKIE